MKNNWNDITIAEYKQIVDIQKAETDNNEKIVALVALLAGMSEDEVWNMPISKLAEYTKQLDFLNEFPDLKKVKYNKLKIGDKWDLRCDINMKNFSVAQYMDFQNYWSQKEKDLARVISVFYTPKDSKYTEGYDVEELVHDIEHNVSIVEANEIVFFFVIKLFKSTKLIQIYLDMLRKRLMKKMKK